ncbi:MAG: hypothetical protein HY650_15365 [Acidobacteria bacterium]|nr:hypothetical protein [Acidobacteriota bacterium]
MRLNHFNQTSFLSLAWVTLIAFATLPQTVFAYHSQKKANLELKDQELSPTVFTYQGQLRHGSEPVNGHCELQFTLYTAQTRGDGVGSVLHENLNLINGSFSVLLDFGGAISDGNGHWLEVAVRPSGSHETYTVLSPRQKLASTPYAIFAQAGAWSLIGVPVGVPVSTEVGATVPEKMETEAELGSEEVVESVRLDQIGQGGVKPTTGSKVALAPLGTPNFLAKFDGAGNPTADSIIFDNGNVGIGTTTPGFPLTFPNTPGDKISLWGQSGTHYGFGIQNFLLQIHTNTSSADIAFGAGSSASFTERMRIKGNGNVGIGTTGPGAKLHVLSSGDIAHELFDTTATTNKRVRINFAQNGSQHMEIGTDFSVNNTADLYIYNRATGQTVAYFNPSGNVWFNMMGNVGIGTTTPGFPLTLRNTLGDKISLWGQSGAHYGFGIQPSLLQIHTEGPFADVAFGTGSSDSFTELMRIKGNGNVGIGTDSPIAKLDIHGGPIHLKSPGGTLRANLNETLSGAGGFETFGPNGLENIRISNMIDNPNHGAISVLDVNGNSQADMFVDDNGFGTIVTKVNGTQRARIEATPAGAGTVLTFGPNGRFNALMFQSENPNHGAMAVADANGTIKASLTVDTNGNGVVSGAVKQFHQAHPTKPGMEIVYASIEGPEAAAYVRGTGRLVNGRATIALPEHFAAIAAENTMTVQLTPHSATSTGLAIVEKSLKGIVVQELLNGTGSYKFDYLVMAVRRGYEDYQPVRTEGWLGITRTLEGLKSDHASAEAAEILGQPKSNR